MRSNITCISNHRGSEVLKDGSQAIKTAGKSGRAESASAQKMRTERRCV